jgi:hypothetical protein
MFPDELPPQGWRDDPVSEEAALGWGRAIERLVAMPMALADDNVPYPSPIDLSGEARELWIDWFNRQSREVMAAEHTRLAGMLSKARSTCARLALIIASLRWATRESATEQLAGVEREDVEAAITLVDYLKSTYERADFLIYQGAGTPECRAILSWLRRHQPTEFRLADMKDTLRKALKDSSATNAAIESLVHANAIRLRPEESIPGKRGRKSSLLYEVNPAVWATPRID